MPKTSGLSLEELKAKRQQLMSQGKELSTSKDLGKIENAIKTLQPNMYSDKQVASAKLALSSSTQPSLSASSGSLSALEQQLASKKDALLKATKNLNDNPWYSEATRVGKLAKLNNIAQLEIGNIQSQINQQQVAQQNAQAQANWEKTFGLQKQQASKTAVTTATDNSGNITGYDSLTGKVLYTIPGAGGGTTSTSKYNTQATAIFKDVDKSATTQNPNAKEDKLLSAGEQYMILQRIKALVGGDDTLAAQVFQNIWDINGYENYGG